MRGVTEQRNAAIDPVIDRIAIAEHPAPPLLRHFEQLARAGNDMGETVQHLLALAGLVAAHVFKIGDKGGDQVESAPALQRIVHHVTFRAGPERRRVPAQVFRHLFERQYRAIGDVTGKPDRIVRPGNALADLGLDAVGADHRVRVIDVASLGANLGAGRRVLAGDHALLVDQRNGVVRLAGFEEGAVQVGAVNDGVRIAEELAEQIAERTAEDLLAGHAVHHDQRVDIDRARAALIADAEIVHRVERIGTDLNAGADFAELVGLLQHGDATALVGQSQRRCQTADAAAGDDDRGHAFAHCCHCFLPYSI